MPQWDATVVDAVHSANPDKHISFKIVFNPVASGKAIEPVCNSVVQLRRYSALRQFHAKIISLFPEESRGLLFPPKQFGLSKSIAKERITLLDRYFKNVFACMRIANSFFVRDTFGLTDGLVIYQSYSSCPICMLAERNGISWQPMHVQEANDRVYLNVECPKHGCVSTLYSSSASFFRRMIRPQVTEGT